MLRQGIRKLCYSILEVVQESGKVGTVAYEESMRGQRAPLLQNEGYEKPSLVTSHLILFWVWAWKDNLFRVILTQTQLFFPMVKYMDVCTHMGMYVYLTLAK